jgi:hypothetical protein
MESVVFDALSPQWLEGPEPHMQSDLSGFDPAIPNALKSLRREMESGSRGGRRSAFTGINRLVSLVVSFGVIPMDVGRKRDVAQAFYFCEEVVGRIKSDSPLAVATASNDFGLQVMLSES